MKRPSTTPKRKPAPKFEASPDKTLHIQWPWSMTWMEYVDEMLDYLKSQVGPGHPLYRRKLYVAAVREGERTWFVEGEKDEFYAIVYFDRKKRYGGKTMPLCEILPDWDAVLKRFAADHEEAMKAVAAQKGART